MGLKLKVRVFQWILILGFVVCTLSIATGESVKYYVGTKGNDQFSGTREAPFATLSHAKAIVAAEKARGIEASYEIILLPGKYYLNETLIFESYESGTKEFPYIIKAEEEGTVILSGGSPLKLDWKRYDDRIWQSSVGKEHAGNIERLIANGETLILARYPNYEEGVYPFGGYSKDALSPEKVSKWENPKGGFIHALHSGRWGGMHYRILQKNEDNTVNYEGGWQNNRPSQMHSTFRFVENIFEELDSPGEWFFDKKGRVLYYYPKQNENVEELIFESAHLESLIQLRGRKGAPVTDIYFEGIDIELTSPTFMKTEEQLMRSDWTIYRNGAVLFEGTERCGFRNGTLKNLGGNAIFISNFNRELQVTGNLIEKVGGSGIVLVGSSDAVRSPSFRYEEFVPIHQLDTDAGPKNENYPSECLIENNLIRNIGTIEKQVAGVQIQLASKIRVRYNTIYEVPRAGINIGDGAWGGHILEYNDVYRTVLETGDHGAFNSWGRDRFWHPDRKVMDSIIKNFPELILLDAKETTIIRNNRFRCDHGWDIDLDDGASNYEIYNNLCLSGGIKLREGFYRTVYNNILINNGFHPHVWFEESHDVFTKNIVMSPHQPIQVSNWGNLVDHNYFTDSLDLKKSQEYGVEVHGLADNLKFHNPSEWDFRVSDHSVFVEDGFINFRMDQFGVFTDRLKSLKESPEIPVLFSGDEMKMSESIKWNGATIKNIETPGEQSAAGLSEIAGVLLIEVPSKSVLFDSGLQSGDVIIEANDSMIENVIDLQKMEAAVKWTGRMPVGIWRNQQKMNLILSF